MIYATSINKKAISLDHLFSKPKPKKIAILFGNEGSGLKQEQINLCNKAIFIPINTKVDSLNISNAVAIITYFINI